MTCRRTRRQTSSDCASSHSATNSSMLSGSVSARSSAYLEGAELLQGFPPGWTSSAAVDASEVRKRWRLVGNAVSVPVAEWIGHRLVEHSPYDGTKDIRLAPESPWPDAAWGIPSGERWKANVSAWPVRLPHEHLVQFLGNWVAPLSRRAARGFLDRVLASTLKVDPQFIIDLLLHLDGDDYDENVRSRAGSQPADEGHSGSRQSAREGVTLGAI